MQLIVLTALVMCAFAANSILNRAGVASGGILAEQFALLRVLAGAAVLLVVLMWRKPVPILRPNIWAVLGLSVYLVGFSQAYITLDAGLGALLLFGGVQVTMFAGAVLMAERIPALRWLGMCVSFGGLVWLVGHVAYGDAPWQAMLSMLAAAVGWGVYSLIGKGESDPIRATTWNFVGAAVVVSLVTVTRGLDLSGISAFGYGSAIASGAVASAMGYALWYAVLPRISASQAAVAQLSVPVIAFLGGAVFLSETITARDMAAAFVVLGGVALSLWPQAR